MRETLSVDELLENRHLDLSASHNNHVQGSSAQESPHQHSNEEDLLKPIPELRNIELSPPRDMKLVTTTIQPDQQSFTEIESTKTQQEELSSAQGPVDALDYVKVESKASCLQDALVFVTQAKAASDAAVNMIKSVYSEQQENKDYIKVSKPLLDASTLLSESLYTLQEVMVNLEPEETTGDITTLAEELEQLDECIPDDSELPFNQVKELKEENGLLLEPLSPEVKPKIKKKRGRKPKVKKDLDDIEEEPKPKKEKKELPPQVDTSEIDSAWEENEYKCKRCSFATFNRKYFDDHKSGTFNIIKCPYCAKLAPNKEQLGIHVSKEHGMTGTTGYKCDFCEKVFKLRRLYALRWHRETEHEGILYHCPLCEYNSKSPLRLQHHHQAKHEGMVYLCDKCQYKTRYKRNLNSHMKNFHSGLPPIKPEKKTHVCDVCGKLGTNKFHMKCLTKQREQQGQILRCEDCNFTTYSQFSLRHHIETHKGETHMCDQCNYTTTHKINLVVHIKTVHKERKMLKCELCDFTTKSHQYMWKHKKVTHSGPVVMHNCTETDCTFTCMFPSDLKRHHDKVHKGIRWACELCDFSAGYKGDLNRHIKIVHQDFKVDCDLCEYSTPKRYYLKEHMIKTHGIQLKKEATDEQL